mmetsp:Transcript_29263/g.73490  ORF Transcript_29263/g.73490 Transcript_29263/m.73490 type:complete len:262 (+) Transcript_29263:802-1587(+)
MVMMMGSGSELICISEAVLADLSLTEKTPVSSPPSSPSRLRPPSVLAFCGSPCTFTANEVSTTSMPCATSAADWFPSTLSGSASPPAPPGPEIVALATEPLAARCAEILRLLPSSSAPASPGTVPASSAEPSACAVLLAAALMLFVSASERPSPLAPSTESAAAARFAAVPWSTPAPAASEATCATWLSASACSAPPSAVELPTTPANTPASWLRLAVVDWPDTPFAAAMSASSALARLAPAASSQEVPLASVPLKRVPFR